MESTKLSIRSALSFGFYKTAKHLGLLCRMSIEVTLLLLCVNALMVFLLYYTQPAWMTPFFPLLVYIPSMFMTIGTLLTLYCTVIPFIVLFYYMHPEFMISFLNISFIPFIPFIPWNKLSSWPPYFMDSYLFKVTVDFVANYPFSGIVVWLFFFFLHIIYCFGWSHVMLDIYDRGKGSVTAFFSFRLLAKAVIAYCFYTLIVICCTSCFVIPGIIAYLRFGFFPFFIIDKKVGPLKALIMSWDATKGHFWTLFGFFCIGLIIRWFFTIIPVLGALIGLLFPSVMSFAWVYFYRKLVPAR